MALVRALPLALVFTARPRLRLATVALGLAGLCPRPIEAAECGAFVGDEGDNLIFYGILAETRPLPICSSHVYLRPTPSKHAAVCWRDMFGQWHLEDFAFCNSYTLASERLMILAGDGDDVVMPISHQGTNEEFVCPIAGTTGTLLPSFGIPASPGLLEWFERHTSHTFREPGSSCLQLQGCANLPMGVLIAGGLGEDELHGAPGSDTLTTSDIFGPPWCLATHARGSGDSAIDACVCAIDLSCCSSDWDWDCVDIAETSCGVDCSDLTAFTADGEVDTACGHGGNDSVIGDDDPEPYGHERLAGGPGTDTCNGIHDSGGGDCCTATAAPGCADDPTIEAGVCAVDPYCCTTSWDSICVGEVEPYGGGACGELPCCTPSMEPGCDDLVLEGLVCAIDPFCCDVRWDSLCVGEVDDVGGSCTPEEDVATTTCETVVQAIRTDLGEGALARATCADDHIESLPPLPPDTPLYEDFVASDFLPTDCWF